MGLLSNYPDGSDLTIINTEYRFPKKDYETGKYDNGSITLVYKDNVTGEKHNEYIEDPAYEFYFAKKGTEEDYNELFKPMNDVEKYTVPYRNLDKEVAKLTDNLEFYYDNIKCGNRYANKQIHLDTRLFRSDINIEDFYRANFSEMYTNKSIPINKSYMDIEVDGINMTTDFVNPQECPINAVTYIDDKTNKVYTLLLRNKDNPLIDKFEKGLGPKLFTKLKDFIRDKVGGWKNEIRFGLDKLEYEVIFYDEEIQLIQDLFIIINTLQPDFLLAWNMAFDIPFIIDRIKALGYNPVDILCHPDFKNPICEYFVDTRNENDLAERGDYAKISSYTVFLDQMIEFASRRKGQSLFPNYKLDTIGEMVAKVRKHDYSHITTRIEMLPYLDYETFFFYNIMDVIVQKCIERKTGDLDYVFNKCLMNNVRYNKCHRQTVYLVDRGAEEFAEDGLIIGNNANKFNEKPEKKFPGALVADPKLLNDYAKEKIDNKYAINMLRNPVDYDFKSLYPSLMRELNIAPHTQIGKVVIPNEVFSNENRFNNKIYDRGTAFIDDIHSGVYLEFCHRWLHFANYSELYKDIIEYFTIKKNPSVGLRICSRNTGAILPVQFLNKDLSRRVVTFHKDPIRPLYFYKKPELERTHNYFYGG